ncbi:MAG: energy transducer TonB, partial [Bacteroidales bacterium]|nr:energy transducer TonB [Bacteroidales bacterium]
NVSEKTLSLLEKMMSPLKKNRPQNMTEVLNLLQTTSQTQNSEEDNTTINEEDTLVNRQKEETKEKDTTPPPPKQTIETPNKKEKNNKKILFIILAVLVVLILTLIIVFSSGKTSSSDTSSLSSTVSNTESVTEEVAEKVEEIKDSITNANVLSNNDDGKSTYSLPYETEIVKIGKEYRIYLKENDHKLTQNQISFIKKNCINKSMDYTVTGYSSGNSREYDLTVANTRAQQVIHILLSGISKENIDIDLKNSKLSSEKWKNQCVVISMSKQEEEEIFTIVEVPASFPGGMQALSKYLSEHIKYPETARTNGIQGKVYITFVVEKDGSISNAKILRDIGGGCGAEALRVVKSMPKWNPAKQRKLSVRQQFNLPVNFQLQ